MVRYNLPRGTGQGIFPLAVRAEADLIRGRTAYDAAMMYQLWDRDSRNMIDEFETDSDALAAAREHLTPDDLGAMVETRVVGDVIERIARPGLGVDRSIDNVGDARLHDGAGAHRTRFERRID